MTKNSKLDLFIQESIKHGKSFEEIKRVLLEAGWQKHQIRSGLETYYLTKYPIAVPKPKPFISPRLFFLYLLYFLMLYLVVYNTVSLLFICLNYYLLMDWVNIRNTRTILEKIFKLIYRLFWFALPNGFLYFLFNK